MLCPILSSKPGSQNSRRTLLRTLRTFRAALLCIALGVLITAPALFAQSSSPSSTAAASSAKSALPALSAAERLAQSIGQAESAAIDWTLDHSGPHGDSSVGDYRIVYTITGAEGWWDKGGNGTLVWHEPPANNIHLRIFVLSRANGRLVPNLSVHATLTDANGNQQVAPIDYGWYPLINAYGGNVPISADSDYSLHVAVDADESLAPRPLRPPSLAEHYTLSTVVDFPPVPVSQQAIAALPLASAAAASSEALLLKPFNEALSHAITALWQHSASGAEKAASGYFIGYAFDDTQGLRRMNLLDFSGKDDVRLEVLVRDARTGRLIAGLKPQADLFAANNTPVTSGELPPAWHPWLFLYGQTLRIPRKGIYRLRVAFDAPGFRRWGHESERFALPADVEFENLSLKPEEAKPGKTNP